MDRKRQAFVVLLKHNNINTKFSLDLTWVLQYSCIAVLLVICGHGFDSFLNAIYQHHGIWKGQLFKFVQDWMMMKIALEEIGERETKRKRKDSWDK